MQEREIKWAGKLRGIEPAEVLNEFVKNTPLGRTVVPGDVAGAVAFLAGLDASFITGIALPVTGDWDLPWIILTWKLPLVFHRIDSEYGDNMNQGEIRVVISVLRKLLLVVHAVYLNKTEYVPG